MTNQPLNPTAEQRDGGKTTEDKFSDEDDSAAEPRRPRRRPSTMTRDTRSDPPSKRPTKTQWGSQRTTSSRRRENTQQQSTSLAAAIAADQVAMSKGKSIDWLCNGLGDKFSYHPNFRTNVDRDTEIRLKKIIRDAAIDADLDRLLPFSIKSTVRTLTNRVMFIFNITTPRGGTPRLSTTLAYTTFRICLNAYGIDLSLLPHAFFKKLGAKMYQARLCTLTTPDEDVKIKSGRFNA